MLYLPRPRYDGERPLLLGANFIDGLAVDIYNISDSAIMQGLTVDLDKLDGATLRFRRDGDRFAPYGGKNKKLKQYFIDNKIPCRDRDRIPLICKGNNVLVVVGVEISDEVKITQSTLRRARVELRY